MHVLEARNLHDALPAAVRHLTTWGNQDKEDGPFECAQPVTTVYGCPTERAPLHPEQDADPFTSLLAGLSRIGGLPAGGQLTRMVEDMAGGRYGTLELASKGRAYFRVLPATDHLNMLVVTQDEDPTWPVGDVVDFSMVHEFVASALEVKPGVMRRVTTHYRAPAKALTQLAPLAQRRGGGTNPYSEVGFQPYPMVVTPWRQWLQDLDIFLDEGPIIGLRDPFFRRVVTPVYMAQKAYVEGDGADRYNKALEVMEQCYAVDWRRACREWLQRRKKEAGY